MNSNHNMLKNNFTNAHTGYLNNGMPERCQVWVDLPETRNMLNSSVGKTFINIPYENYEFGLRRMYTIDTADLTNKQHLCALPKIENSFTMCANKKNPSQHGNNGNNSHVNLHENKSFNVQENHRFPQNNTKDVDIRNPTHNFQHVNSMPSFGTQFHHKGRCSPCKYEWTRGCHLGSLCRFCHDQSHVPEGTQRVLPNPQELAITRVKPENIFTSPISRNNNAPSVTKPANILNGKKKNRKHKKNTNKRQRTGGENKMNSQKEEEKTMNSKKEEEKKTDSKKKEDKMGNQKKEYKRNNQKKERKRNNQKKERKRNNQKNERKTNNQKNENKTNNQKNESKTNNQKNENKTNNQKNENKTNNQTNENKTNNQTKEHNIYNCPRGNKINYQNNKNSKKMNNVVNERNPQNIGNTERNRNQTRKINYNDYTTLNTSNCTYNHNPHEDDFLNGHLNGIISNIVSHNEENDLSRIFCIIFKRDNAFEDYECLNLFVPDTVIHHMNIYPLNMVPMRRH
ncbi:conserved Plasmodium protein, unknown function [Plasmodium reichenowi]|uniref:C3H1-type domain-containing protein n=1 Tax=Plasmodium reichenowi TaxID=5854 RepID=A0A2P9D4U1_PLARE|nr:conserved Plasmodium protein, unknown function [Plasmodium reichenowi]